MEQPKQLETVDLQKLIEICQDYINFIDNDEEYHKQHKYCPKCGGEQHTTTHVGYVLNWDKKDEYKDLNRCVCTKCGDNHSAHDRLPSIEALS